MACGGGGTAPKSVTGNEPPPDMLEDFSTYSSISNLLADPRGIYSVGEDVNTGQMVLDNTVGYGTSGKSLRFDFPDRTADSAGRCGVYTIGRNITLPSSVSELWVEIAARYSGNWTT